MLESFFKIKFISSFILLLLLQPMNSYADFKAVDNLELLEQIIFEEANSDSLVIFDIDDVLISPIDEFNFNSDIRKNLKKTMQQRKDKNEIKEIFSDFFS